MILNKYCIRFMALIILVCSYLNSAEAAEIFVNDSKPRGDIVITGVITEGDYHKFIKVLLEAGISEGNVYISSNGGDVVEAIKIGKLIRTLNFNTYVPYGDKKTGTICSGYDVDYCGCESACFLIYLSGYERNGSVLGVHRSFINHEILKNLSPVDAKKHSKTVNRSVNNYMREMGAPISLIDKITNIPSSEIQYLEKEYIDENLAGHFPAIDEWIIANCGSTDKLWVAFDKATPSRQEEIHVKMEEVFECRGKLSFSVRQEAFHLGMTKVLLEENLNPYPEIIANVHDINNLNFLDFINKPASGVTKYLSLYGFGIKKGDQEFADRYLTIGGGDLGNIYLVTDSAGIVSHIMFNFVGSDTHNGYKGPLFKELDHLSKSDNFFESLGLPSSLAGGYYVNLVEYKLINKEISIMFDPDDDSLRGLRISSL